MRDFYPTQEHAQEAHDRLMKIGELTVRFAGIERFTYYPSGRPENDAEHSFHLGLSTIELAATYFPHLDVGLVAQFSYVHDLPEVYAGDTPSHNLTKQERIEKEAREHDAKERLLLELPPHIADLLKRYEEQTEPEARFVRFVDKLLPSIIHSVSTETNRDVYTYEMRNDDAAAVHAKREQRTQLLHEMFPELDFDFIFMIRELTSATARSRIFSERPELI